MNAKDFFASALEQATVVMERVQAGDLGKPTPDTEWDVRALTNHMVYELSWVADLVNGKTIAEVGDKYEGDLVGDDPVGKWRTAVAEAQGAVDKADASAPVQLSY